MEFRTLEIQAARESVDGIWGSLVFLGRSHNSLMPNAICVVLEVELDKELLLDEAAVDNVYIIGGSRVVWGLRDI